MASNQGYDGQVPQPFNNAEERPTPQPSESALRGGQPGGREADGLDAAQRGLADDPLDSELESTELEELARDVRLKLTGPRRGKQRSRTQQPAPAQERLRPAQRLLILDTWLRSKLPAREFCSMFGPQRSADSPMIRWTASWNPRSWKSSRATCG